MHYFIMIRDDEEDTEMNDEFELYDLIEEYPAIEGEPFTLERTVGPNTAVSCI